MDHRGIPIFLSCTLLSLFLLSAPSHAQSCSAVSLSTSNVYTTCTTLPSLNASLHWTYSPSAGTADIAFLVTGITASNWVAWALNPTGQGMAKAQALVAFQNTSGVVQVYTSSVASESPSTQLTKSSLSFTVDNLTATMTLNTQMVIFATVHLPGNQTTLNHVWQVGPLSGNTPVGHVLDTAHTTSLGTVDFLSGVASSSGGGSPSLRKKNVHGVLNAVSWGILMPIGAMLARYVRVFEIGTPIWFYLHVACQLSAYVVGVAGFGTGLQMGSGVYTIHRNIGITLFTFATLQVFALLLRPKPDHKYRFYWNVYHRSIGYMVITLSIVNIFKGLGILHPANKWKKAYIGILIFLACVALILEAVKWLLYFNRKRSVPVEEKDSSYYYGNGNVNNVGVNGSRSSHPTV